MIPAEQAIFIHQQFAYILSSHILHTSCTDILGFLNTISWAKN